MQFDHLNRRCLPASANEDWIVRSGVPYAKVPSPAPLRPTVRSATTASAALPSDPPCTPRDGAPGIRPTPGVCPNRRRSFARRRTPAWVRHTAPTAKTAAPPPPALPAKQPRAAHGAAATAPPARRRSALPPGNRHSIACIEPTPSPHNILPATFHPRLSSEPASQGPPSTLHLPPPLSTLHPPLPPIPNARAAKPMASSDHSTISPYMRISWE